MSPMTDEEIKPLIERNATTTQAILDAMAEARHERQELREGIIQLQSAFMRLTNLQEGIANLLVALDEDRPTILRKLNSIENKLDKILVQNEGESS